MHGGCKFSTMFGEYEKTVESILALYKDFLNEHHEFYIFGTKVAGQKIFTQFSSAGYKVSGFIDNNKSIQGTKLFDKNIFALDELDDKKEDVVIVIASINYCYEIYSQLKREGYKKIVPIYILNLWQKDIFPPEAAFDGLIGDYIVNKLHYEKLYNALKDEYSKHILNEIIKFRQTYDVEIYSKINSPIDQYFDEMVKLKEDEVFVDGGAFDGDTVKRFLKYSGGKYQKIYFFEPDPQAFLQAKENLKDLQNIEFFQKGLSDCGKNLMFDSRGDFGSLFCDCGDLKIECCALDDVVSEEKALIKLDIEGFELDCLKGARRLIQRGSTLVICVYHKPSDIWEIFEYISLINPNYDFYLRHYTTNIFETVLYAIPRKEK